MLACLHPICCHLYPLPASTEYEIIRLNQPVYHRLNGARPRHCLTSAAFMVLHVFHPFAACSLPLQSNQINCRYVVVIHSLLPSGGTVKVPKSAVSVPAHGTVRHFAVPADGTALYRLAVLPLPFGGTAFVIFLPMLSSFINAHAPVW